MPALPIRLTIVTLALSFATVAAGQPGDWYVAPSIIFNNDAAYRAIDDSLSGIQVNAGRDMTEHLSLEGVLSYSDISAYPCVPGDCYPGQRHIDLGANLLTYFNRDSKFAPYLLVGVGYLNVNLDSGTQFTRGSGDTAATASGALGFKWRMGDSNWSIRGEHRARVAFDDTNLTDQITAIGVQYNFGARRSDPGIPEVGGDEAVVPMNIERDSDDDRVNDSMDECPNTPLGAVVDRKGCSLDSDMDGVTTDKDRCPATRAGASVNIYGCENDDDRDGVPNHRDSCPDTRSGARIDVRGCEIRDIISLPGVNFETGFDILLPGTEYVLKEAADTLIRYPELHIEVAGHSDNVGDSASNEGLSERRARTVRHHLIQFGVAEDRLTFKGYGESEPIADNDSAEGRATNRRVELRLISR